jgi:hypothetical protein
LKIAVGEEYITDSGLSRDRWFFTSVETDRGDIEPVSGLAVAIFTRASADTAVPRAESADLSFDIIGSRHILNRRDAETAEKK